MNSSYRAFLAAAQAIRGGEGSCLAVRALPLELPLYSDLVPVFACANARANNASGDDTPTPVHFDIEIIPAGDGYSCPPVETTRIRYGGGASFAELLCYPDGAAYWSVGCYPIRQGSDTPGPILAAELRRVAQSIEQRWAAGKKAAGESTASVFTAECCEVYRNNA